MIVALIVGCVVSIGLISVLSFIQLLYGENARLRRRDAPGLAYFEETIQPRLNMEPDFGGLVYSMTKQAMLVVMSLSLYSLLAMGTEPWLALIETLLFAVIVLMLFSFLLPQVLFRRSTGQWLTLAVPLLVAVAFLVKPFAKVLQFIQTLFGMTDEQPGGEEESSTAEDIDALITAGEEEGLIEEDDRKLIQSVVEFGDKTVREVMTPRPKIVGIDESKTLEELREVLINEQYSRIPVFRADIDHLVGFVHVRDLFECDDDERARLHVKDIMRPLPLVPETKPVKALLEEMQAKGFHIVGVISEYGTTAGLATMEDLVEEIVGEIRDEHEPTRDVVQEPNGNFVVAGSYDVDHLKELVDFRVENDTQSTTIGGLVTEWLGRVPSKGEVVERDGLRLEVLASDDFRVDRVRISRVSELGDDAE